MKKFFADDQIINFYKNFFDNPHFSQKDLDKLIRIKKQLVEDPKDLSPTSVS